MRAKRTAIALAVLFGSFGWTAHDASARSAEVRQAKPAARAAAAPAAARPAAARPANANARATAQRGRNVAANRATANRATARASGTRAAAASGRGGISCVPYARQVTGMTISGNGRDWWHNAAGLYDRGNRPEVGSVMAFPGSGGMRSGHVAVVERVVSQREVLIHHANWGGPGIRRGSIMRGVSVIDVSPNNDWTQVRVQVGHSAENYGRIYPVYGFIHNRPDTGRTYMADGRALRINAADAARLGLEEVAQARPARR